MYGCVCLILKIMPRAHCQRLPVVAIFERHSRAHILVTTGSGLSIYICVCTTYMYMYICSDHKNVHEYTTSRTENHARCS